MATPSPDHRQRTWNQIVTESRAESSPPIEVRQALRKQLIRITAERSWVISCLLDMEATCRMAGALAAAVGVLAAVGIFLLRDAPSFFSDPILFLLSNR
jgi:hypothetical protein